MKPLHNAFAWLFALYAAISLPWSAYVLYLAFFRESSPMGRSGDVVGPPDAFFHYVGSAVLLAAGLAALAVGALNLVASLGYLKRAKRHLMGFASIANGIVWGIVALFALLALLDFEVNPLPRQVFLLTATGLAPLHIFAARMFLGRRARSDHIDGSATAPARTGGTATSTR